MASSVRRVIPLWPFSRNPRNQMMALRFPEGGFEPLASYRRVGPPPFFSARGSANARGLCSAASGSEIQPQSFGYTGPSPAMAVGAILVCQLVVGENKRDAV